ncbi:MAG: 50S ribosomal protein L17 [Prosthecobacter sp.]
MNHGRKVVKLKRSAAHRRALLANLVCSLVEHRRIRTTLAKAKALRPFAERMLTLAKRGDLHARRTAVSYLRQQGPVKKLFEEIAPASMERKGGYTRITKLGQRRSDAAPMAFIEWVDAYVPAATKSVEAEVVPVTAEPEVIAPKKKAAPKKAKAASAE